MRTRNTHEARKWVVHGTPTETRWHTWRSSLNTKLFLTSCPFPQLQLPRLNGPLVPRQSWATCWLQHRYANCMAIRQFSCEVTLMIQIQDPPTVTWAAEADAFYTIIMTGQLLWFLQYLLTLLCMYTSHLDSAATLLCRSWCTKPQGPQIPWVATLGGCEHPIWGHLQGRSVCRVCGSWTT